MALSNQPQNGSTQILNLSGKRHENHFFFLISVISDQVTKIEQEKMKQVFVHFMSVLMTPKYNTDTKI